ncbi:MAG: lytic murein transglycosylase, partial [Proteobacteria bacterium]|nr:lytic murein transglycosylase [Pseudomonadota bacterium]
MFLFSLIKGKKFLWLAILSLLLVGFGNRSEAKVKYSDFTKKERNYLIQLMEKKGLQKKFLNKVFNKKLKKITFVVKQNVINKESKRDYQNFYSAYSIKTAYRFSRKWRTLLSRASRKFKVDKEVLVAIFLVETGLGNIMGQYPVISVYSSIVVDNHFRNPLSQTSKKLSDLEIMRAQRLRKKADWAKAELNAFLKIIKKSKKDPQKFKGSFAGAFGIPQFLPSSYLKWGYDSDNNGTVNLYLFPDAIYSVANYLKAHGWKKGLYRKSNREVVWKYNHSKTYVKTVLTVAQKIQ